MADKPQTVEAYIDALPASQKAALEQVLSLIRNSLPDGYEEVMSFGMPTWQVPLSAYPDTYNKQPLLFAGLASRKKHLSLYLSGPFSDPAIEQALTEGFAKAGKTLDMGSSCVRFKTMADLDLASIEAAIKSMPMPNLIARVKAAQAAKKR